MISLDDAFIYLKENYRIEVTNGRRGRVITLPNGNSGGVTISRRTNPRGGNTQASAENEYQIFINPYYPDDRYSRIFLIDENRSKNNIGRGTPGSPVTLNNKSRITINYPHVADPGKNKEFWDGIKGFIDLERENGIILYDVVPNPDNENIESSLSQEGRDNAYFEILNFHRNLIIEGVAGSGKSHMLQELRTSRAYGNNGSRIEVVVFHPSTSYEEFVSGIRPNFDKRADESDFLTQEGVFVQICNRAAQDPDNAYLLFIDEINRANTARVFGDLMLVLEKSKRQEFKDLEGDYRDGALFEAGYQEMPGDYVRLQTPIFKNGKEYNKLAVPTNLHVLGTMNTTDRSVGTIDLALRRRFHWVAQHPLTSEELQRAMEENGEEYPGDIASWYEKANVILLNQVGPDARLGHAYFFEKDGDEDTIAEALLNQLKEVAFTFNISQTILDEIGPVNGQKIFIRGAGLGARPDIVDDSYQG